MNLIDLAILLILGITILGGLYRGFLNTALAIGATVLAFLIGMACIPLLANLVKEQESLYNMMLYYTEGAEYVAETNVEWTRISIQRISAEQLQLVIDNAGMPLPMGACIRRNMATEAFAAYGVTTLGDYFNQTIVNVVINILCVLLGFAAGRIALGFLLHGIDYACGGLPVLQRGDMALGAALGLLHGVLLLFVLFLLLPIGLTILPKFYRFIEQSFFGEFFYKANFLLNLIPGT